MPASHGWSFELVLGRRLNTVVLRNRITIGSWASGLCALQLTMIRRAWRPALRASNDFSHSLKMACVIYALLLFRYLQPMVSRLMFFQTTRTFRLSYDKERQLVTSIAIAAHCQGDTLFVLFAAFQMLCCQRIICL